MFTWLQLFEKYRMIYGKIPTLLPVFLVPSPKHTNSPHIISVIKSQCFYA